MSVNEKQGIVSFIPQFVKFAVKKHLGSASYRLGLYPHFAAGKAIVVVFHSICDHADQSPIATSPPKFEQFCRFFKNNFNVISMGELVLKLERGLDVTGDLVITFDDGYKDNLTNAVPILKKHDLPALFYVVTDYVCTDTQTWWDQKAGVETRWLDWDEVREMHRMGFEIGAHTKTHANLGEIHTDTCRDEVLESFDRLEKELGKRPRFFSYPYGGKEHLSLSNQRVLQEIKIPYVAGAFGGFVSNGTDPAFICRLPIGHWFRTPEQFGFELLMLAKREPSTAEHVRISSHPPAPL